MGRKLRIFQSTFPYHVFNRTNNKEFIFDPFRDFPIFLACLKDLGMSAEFQTHHFILVKNHYHLMGSTPLANLNEVMCLLQTTVAKIINSKIQRINHIFGSRYGASVVKTDAYQAALIRYMYHNATKAKLVRKAGDYPYSTLRYYLDGTWEELGLTLDPYLASLAPGERRDFFLSLNAAQMDDKSYEEFGKKLRRKVYL